MVVDSIALGALGGIAVQLLAFAEIATVPKEKRPDLKSWVFWIPYVVNPVAGAIVGFLYFHNKQDLDYILAVHIGASAPLILRSFANVIPNEVKQNTV